MVGASPFAPGPSRPRKKVEKVISRADQVIEAVTANKNDSQPTSAGPKPSKKTQRVVDVLSVGKDIVNFGKSLFGRAKGKGKSTTNPYGSFEKTSGVGKQENGVVVVSMDGVSREEALRCKVPVVQEHNYQPMKSSPLTLSDVELINATREYFHSSLEIELTFLPGAKALSELEGTKATGSTSDLHHRKLSRPSLVAYLTLQTGLDVTEEAGAHALAASTRQVASSESQENIRNRIKADIVIDRTVAALAEKEAVKARQQV